MTTEFNKINEEALEDKPITGVALDEKGLELVNGAGRHIINDEPPFWDETNPNNPNNQM